MIYFPLTRHCIVRHHIAQNIYIFLCQDILSYNMIYHLATNINYTFSHLRQLSKPQPKLNPTVGFDLKMTLQPSPPPTTQTQSQQYLSCYWPDFDETLKVGSCEHLEQIPTDTVTFVHAIFVQATFVLVTFVHIRNISAVTDTIWTKL